MTSNETERSDLWSASDKWDEVTRAPQRRLLPHDLDVALKYLTAGELTALAKAVSAEQSRRGQQQVQPEATARKLANKKTGHDVPGLTQSQINLIRSSVQAGVKPATLSRQFGITKAQISAALKTNK